MSYAVSESLHRVRSMTGPTISTTALTRDSPGSESTPSPSSGYPRESLSRRSTLNRTSLVPAGPRPLPTPVRTRTASITRTVSPPPMSPALSGIPAPPMPPVAPLASLAAAVPRPLSPTRRLGSPVLGARKLSITAVKSLASVPMLPFSSATTISGSSSSPRASPTLPSYNESRMSTLYETVPATFAMSLSKAPLTADSCAPELTPDEGSSDGWQEEGDQDDDDAAVSVSGYSRSEVGSAMNAVVQTAVRVGFHESDGTDTKYGTDTKFAWPDPWAAPPEKEQQPSHPPPAYPRLRVVVPRRTLVVCNATGMPESPTTPLPPVESRLPAPSSAAQRRSRTKSQRSGKSLHRMSQSSRRTGGGGTVGRRAAARLSLISNTTSGSTLPTFASNSSHAGPSSPRRGATERPPSPDLLHPLYKRSQSPPIPKAKSRKKTQVQKQPLSFSAVQQLHHVQEEDPFELAAKNKGLRLLGVDGPQHVPAPMPFEPMASPVVPQSRWRLPRAMQSSRQKVAAQPQKKGFSFTIRRIFGRRST